MLSALGCLFLGYVLGGLTELIGKTLYTSAGIHELLLACIERVALIAKLYVELWLSGTRLESVTARARYGALHVFWMDSCFHLFSLSSLGYGQDT
jgi:hypothetical protein